MAVQIGEMEVTLGKDIEKVLITYSDGSTKEIEKCLIVEEVEEVEQNEASIHFLKLSYEEIISHMTTVAVALREMIKGGE